jgi:hypothetical protein
VSTKQHHSESSANRKVADRHSVSAPTAKATPESGVEMLQWAGAMPLRKSRLRRRSLRAHLHQFAHLLRFLAGYVGVYVNLERRFHLLENIGGIVLPIK